MSETPPVPRDRRRFYRGLLYVGISAVLLLGLIVTLKINSGIMKKAMQVRNTDNLSGLRDAIQSYADKHSGRLPTTLSELTPEYLSPEDFTFFRYRGRNNGERLDWLYFPKENLEGLPEDTILVAAPEPSPGGYGKQGHLVLDAHHHLSRIPEADFQRLIREQNPPPPAK